MGTRLVIPTAKRLTVPTAKRFVIDEFSPLLISDLNLWLDAADEDSITDDAGAISQWNDKSGNGFNVVQSSSSLKPTYVSSVQNGNNIVRWDGGDSLTRDPFTWPTQYFTVFFVHKTTTATNSNLFRTVTFETNRISAHTPWGGATPIFYFDFGNTSTGRLQYTYSAGGPLTSWTQHTCRNESGVGQQVWRDGTLRVSDGTTDDFGSPGNYTLEVGNTFNGDLGELIMFNRALETWERLQMEKYLEDKWGL